MLRRRCWLGADAAAQPARSVSASRHYRYPPRLFPLPTNGLARPSTLLTPGNQFPRGVGDEDGLPEPVLKAYATMTTLLCVILISGAFAPQGQKTKFDEIDVERINIVEPDGQILNQPDTLPPNKKAILMLSPEFTAWHGKGCAQATGRCQSTGADRYIDRQIRGCHVIRRQRSSTNSLVRDQ